MQQVLYRLIYSFDLLKVRGRNDDFFVSMGQDLTEDLQRLKVTGFIVKGILQVYTVRIEDSMFCTLQYNQSGSPMTFKS